MKPILLTNIDEAQQFLLQGMWLQRLLAPTVKTVTPALEWCRYILAEGRPLLMPGLVADVGHALIGTERDRTRNRDRIELPGIPHGLLRSYEDFVLGKIDSDATFDRARDALRRLPQAKRSRGIYFILGQMAERGGFPGVELAPGVVRELLNAGQSLEDNLRRSWEELSQNGPMPLLVEMTHATITGAKKMGDVLAKEDVIALEQGTAVAEVAEYVAHRQIVQMANVMERGLPRQKVRPRVGRREVPTRVLDEDTYPVGGFSSISTRGTIESLLHSQLAYMEPDRGTEPDLFDIKFLRDELYYYSRDENQFLRRRRVFYFLLYPDLAQSRFKDPELPCQRIVMMLALVSAAIRKLVEWLSLDALKFEIVLITDSSNRPLQPEAELFKYLYRELLESQILRFDHLTEEDAERRCSEASRRNMCHALAISAGGSSLMSPDAVMTELQVASARPVLKQAGEAPEMIEADTPEEAWIRTLERLLELWV